MDIDYIAFYHTFQKINNFFLSVGVSKSESAKLERHTYSITCHRNCVGIDCYIGGK